MKSLKKKTINGVFWSFIQNFSIQLNTFIVGIVLARLLSPRDFGLIGMLTIFIALSHTLIDSGFKDALIRKKKCSDEDYSTVFFFNIGMSTLIYLIFFWGAGIIGEFFQEPKLVSLIKVLGITLIINSLFLIPKTKLIKELNFKLMTKVEVSASFLAGLVAIVMAYYGFGVWSLVARTVLIASFSFILFGFWSNWIPKLAFSKESFNEMFSFGSRLAVLGIIDTIYNNIYYLIIGKYYSAGQLGHYTKAEGFKNFPSKGITTIVQKVTYPVLSDIKDDPARMRRAYRKLVKTITLLTFIALLGLSGVAENFTILLLGEEWRLAGEYLQILCIAALFYPLNALNMNIMKVVGRSDLILKLGILKKILAIPVILVGIFFNIKFMILVMIFQQFGIFYLNSHYAGDFIDYKTLEQLKDITRIVLVSICMYCSMYLVDIVLNYSLSIQFAIKILVGVSSAIILSQIFQIQGYLILKTIILDRINEKLNNDS